MPASKKVGKITLGEYDDKLRSGKQSKEVATEAGVSQTGVYTDLALLGGYKIGTIRFIAGPDGRPLKPITEEEIIQSVLANKR